MRRKALWHFERSALRNGRVIKLSDTLPEKLWQPSSDQVARATITKLSQRISAKTGVDLRNYWDLHSWSINNLNDFWSQTWDDAGLVGIKGEACYKAGVDFISSEFFPGARINVAENLLRKGIDDRAAVISIQEDGTRIEVSWRELRSLVAATAAAMRHEGVSAGDRIVACSPNLVEVVVYALAGLSIGVVVSTSSPDFAPRAVLDRFGQIEPVLFLAAESYTYSGKKFDCVQSLLEIAKSLPTLKKTIVIGQANSEFTTFDQWIAPFKDVPLVFDRFTFSHPGFVLFSSGTTGQPKCITHSGAGILLKLSAEHLYHFDLSIEDRVFYFTTCGWMMWNWLLFVLGSGATIILYEGSPVFPTPGRFFDLAQDEKVTFVGVSAKLIDTMNKEGLSPIKTHDLSTLRTIASTGSVLSPASFDYVYSQIKQDVHLVSMSGGTDICGCFLAGIPTLPVYRGELQGPLLGMGTDVFNEAGTSADIDEKGELVCTLAFPSKPLYFWGDVNNEKYRAAYFEGFPNIWTHGDFASKSSTGGFTVHGRSDATLNSRGVRIGTAEIYRVVEAFAEIQESMAVSQEWDGDTRVILFVTMKTGIKLTDELVKRVKHALRTQASPRHVPDEIIAAPELPRTRSNKLVELAVTDAINGRIVRNRDSIANPEALDWFSNLF